MLTSLRKHYQSKISCIYIEFVKKLMHDIYLAEKLSNTGDLNDL